MRSEKHFKKYRLISAIAFAIAAVAAVGGVFLLVDTVTGHGGQAGNILRLGFSALALFLGLVFLAVGFLCLSSASEKNAEP